MKQFYSLLILVLLAFAAKSQTTNWTGAVSTDWQVAGNWDNGLPSGTKIASFGTGTTLTVTNAPAVTVLGLVVTGNTNVTVTATANRTITVSNGTGTDMTIDAGSEFTLGTNVNVTLANNATANIDGTLTVSAGRIYNTNGGGGTKTTVTGTIDNAGTVTCASAAKLAFNSGSTYYHSQNGGTVPTATWDAASTAQFTSIVGTLPTAFDTQTLGNVIWNCPSQTVATSPAALSIAGDLTVQSTGTGEFRFGDPGTNTIGGDLNINGGTVRIGSNIARTVTVTGDVNITGGTLNMSTGNQVGTLNVAGDFSISGGTVQETSTGSGAINFNGASAQTYSKSGGSFANTINFTINAGSTVDFGTSVVDGSSGSFTVSSTAKMITANATGINGTVQVSGTKTFNSGADYEFQGASTGTFTTTPTASTVRNLVVNNTGGNVTLAQPLAVTGDLTLTAGALSTTTTNLVTINAGGTTSGTSFVDGPMAKIGNTAFTFPVGKVGAGRHTIGITAPSASSTIRAEYFRGDPHSLSNTFSGSITQISYCEYWTMNRTAGTGTGRAIPSWETTSNCGGAGYVGNLSNLRVARLNAGTWADDGFLSTTGSTSSGTLTANSTSTFSFSFALATSSPSNPLPVMFADVKAYQRNNGVQIEWSNLTERDIVSYSVERSSDGTHYSPIAQLAPASNRNDKASYTSFDAAPAGGINYYRVKAAEISGKIIYSKTLKVDMNGFQQGFNLYPNPVVGSQVSVSMSVKQGQYTVKVLNANGQQVYSQRFNHPGGFMTQTIDLPTTVKPGVYNMVISGDEYRQSKMFIVQ